MLQSYFGKPLVRRPEHVSAELVLPQEQIFDTFNTLYAAAVI